MQHISLHSAVCLAVLCAVTTCLAHEEDAARAGPEPLDCGRPPADAVTRLPEAIQSFAELVCAPNGQLIVARQDWIWRYPASYFDRPLVAAYSPMASRVEPGSRYFTSLVVEELTGEAARQRNEALLASLPNYRPEASPKSVLRMVATNELGHRFDVYFPMTGADRGWGAICAPDCAPEMLFMIYRNE